MPHIGMNFQPDSFNSEDFLTYAVDRGFGDVHFKFDQETGLNAIIAIHSTVNGPALGGCRCIEYESFYQGLFDALRLARAMSYKAALVNLPHGGGKSVLLKPKTIVNRDAYFKRFGEFVHQMNGRYITAEDVGTTTEDMDAIKQVTSYVAGGAKFNGNPSFYTADGVISGIKAAVKFKLNRDTLEGIHVAIQGAGKVGYHLVKKLTNQGAKVSLADINQQIVNRCIDEFSVTQVDTDKIHAINCDVFAPCALGAVINEDNYLEIKAVIIAGSANNQLDKAPTGELLHKKGILYAPDYVINAGGLIHASCRYNHSDAGTVNNKINEIYDTLFEIFERSQKENQATSIIADKIAVSRIAANQL